MLKNLDSLVLMAKGNETRRIAVASSADKPVLEAIKESMDQDLIIPILIGDKKETERISKAIGLSLDGIPIIDIENPALAARQAVKEVKEGRTL
mgnify:CR=1 FL=1